MQIIIKFLKFKILTTWAHFLQTNQMTVIHLTKKQKINSWPLK